MNLRILLLVTALGGLAACTGGEADAPARQVMDGAVKNQVRIAIKSEPVGLNPVLSVQNISRYVTEQIFQTLNDYDPETFELVPLLASVPTLEPDPSGQGGTVYRYTIDSLATWPNGTPVTAHDVAFSLKAIMNPLVRSGPYRPYYEMVREVQPEPEDDRSFRIVTRRPYILAAEALADLYVYPAYAYDPDDLLRRIPLAALTDPTRSSRSLLRDYPELRTFADRFNDPEVGFNPDRIVGSGPYALVDWVPGQELLLRRRDNYWAGERTAARFVAVSRELRFRIIADNTTTINALRDQAVDVVLDLPEDEFLQLRDDPYLTQFYDFRAVPGFKYFSILLNQDDPLLRDSLTRRALAHIIDVDQLIDQLLPGLARRIVGPVLPTKAYYNETLTEIPYDLDHARELLRQAGWEDTNGDGTLDRLINGQRRELRFQLLSYPTPTSEAITLVTAEGARKVGIGIEVIRREPRSLLASLDAGNFTASIYGQGFEPTPDDFSQVWLSTSVPPNGTNRSNFRSAEADSLIRRIATMTDEEQRADLYRRFQEIVYANQPMIFLYSPYDRIVVAKRFDYEVTSIAPNLKFNALRLTSSSAPDPSTTAE